MTEVQKELSVQTPAPVAQVALDRPMSVVEVVTQVKLIQDVMNAVMKKDEHYGVIPGCGNKPTLLKAGAEKLCLTFRLAPRYEIMETRDGDHLTVVSRCILTHIPTGRTMGEGLGSCSTKESKYAYRGASRVCPNCGKETIIKGKVEYGGGWLCFAKKGGCGSKWPDGAKEIESQTEARVANDNLPDQWNTVVKMANKRSLVAAALNATAASDIFTQDIEDNFTREVVEPTPPPGGNRPPIQPPQQKTNAPAPQGTQTPAPPAAQQTAPPANGGASKLTDAQRKLIFARYKASGISEENFREFLKFSYQSDSTNDIPKKDVDIVLEWIETNKVTG